MHDTINICPTRRLTCVFDNPMTGGNMRIICATDHNSAGAACDQQPTQIFVKLFFLVIYTFLNACYPFGYRPFALISLNASVFNCVSTF